MNIRQRRRKQRRKRLLRNFIIFSVLLCILGGGYIGVQMFFQKDKAQISPYEKINVSQNETAELLSLESKAAILIDLENGEEVGAKSSKEKIYPASLTKIMTTIVAIEHLKNFDETIRLEQDIFDQAVAANASRAGYEPGEEVRVRDLLYGIMLPSGAECSLGIAKAVSGSEAEFVTLMNAKAKELGMKGTNFTNTTGLHDNEQYTTVEDLSLLLQYGLKSELFRTIFTTFSYLAGQTNMHPGGITLQSTLLKSDISMKVENGEIIGGKTGYTSEAGLCLASLARIEGKEYILVTAGAPGDHSTEPYHVMDALNVYKNISQSRN